jgi:hypothetical protein
MGLCISMCVNHDTTIREREHPTSVRFPRKKPKPIVIIPNRPRSIRFHQQN